jgi:hypothetical protein
VLPWILATALLVHAAAHVAMAVRLARRREWCKAALGFFLPPLAPVLAWRAGMRILVRAWAGALAVYAAGVALA